MEKKIKHCIKNEPVVSIEQVNGLEYDMTEIEKDRLNTNSNVGSYFIEIIKDEIFHKFKKEPMDHTLEDMFEAEKGEPKESPVQYNFIDFDGEHPKPNGYKSTKKNKFAELIGSKKVLLIIAETKCLQPILTNTKLTTEVSTISNILPQQPLPNNTLVDKHPNEIPMVKLAPSEPPMAFKALQKNIDKVKAPKQKLLLPSQCLDTVSSKIIEVEPSKIKALETLKSLVVVPSKHSTVEPSTSPLARLSLSPPAVEPLLLSEVERSQLSTAKIRLFEKKSPFSKKILQLRCCHSIVSKHEKLIDKKLSKINKTYNKALKYKILEIKNFFKTYHRWSKSTKKFIIKLTNCEDIKQWKGLQMASRNTMKKIRKLSTAVPQQLTCCKKKLDQNRNFERDLKGDDFENHNKLQLSLIKSNEIPLVNHQELQSSSQPESEHRSIMESLNVSESKFSLKLSNNKPKDLKIKPTQFMQTISDVQPFHQINYYLDQYSEIKALEQQHDLQQQCILQNSNLLLLKISGMKEKNSRNEKLFQRQSRKQSSEPVLQIILAENPLNIGPELLIFFPKTGNTFVFSYVQLLLFFKMHINIQTPFSTIPQFVKRHIILQNQYHEVETLENVLQQYYRYYTLGITSTINQKVSRLLQFLKIGELEQSQFSNIKSSNLTQPLSSLSLLKIFGKKKLKKSPGSKKPSIVKSLNVPVPLSYSSCFSSEQRSMEKTKRKRTPSFTKIKPISRKKNKPVSHIKNKVPKRRNYLRKRYPLENSILIHTKSLKVEQKQKLLKKSSKAHSPKPLKQPNLTKPSIVKSSNVSVPLFSSSSLPVDQSLQLLANKDVNFTSFSALRSIKHEVMKKKSKKKRVVSDFRTFTRQNITLDQHSKIVNKTVWVSEIENFRLQYPHQLNIVLHNNRVKKLLQAKATRQCHKQPQPLNFSNIDSSTGNSVPFSRFPENEPFIAMKGPPSSTVQSLKLPVLDKKAKKRVTEFCVTSNQQSKIRILESQDSQKQYSLKCINAPSLKLSMSKSHKNTCSNEYAIFEAIDLSLLEEKKLQQQRPPLTNTSGHEEIVRYSNLLRVNLTPIPYSILEKTNILGNQKQHKLVDDCTDMVLYREQLCNKLDMRQNNDNQCAKTIKTRTVRKRKSVCSVCRPTLQRHLSLLEEKKLQQQRPPLTNTSGHEEIVRYSNLLRVNLTPIPSSILEKTNILGNQKQHKLVDDCTDMVLYREQLCNKLDMRQNNDNQCAKTIKTRTVRKRKSVCSVCRPNTMSTAIPTSSVFTSVITTPTLASETKSQVNNIKSTPISHESANNYCGSLYKLDTNLTNESANICTSISVPIKLFSTVYLNLVPCRKISSISTAENKKTVKSRDILPRKLKGCRKFGKCCLYC